MNTNKQQQQKTPNNYNTFGLGCNKKSQLIYKESIQWNSLGAFEITTAS